MTVIGRTQQSEERGRGARRLRKKRNRRAMLMPCKSESLSTPWSPSLRSQPVAQPEMTKSVGEVETKKPSAVSERALVETQFVILPAWYTSTVTVSIIFL
jgi:hypothetical protein